jgi:hypothetical protein
MLSVIMLSVIMLSFFMLDGANKPKMLSVVMQNGPKFEGSNLAATGTRLKGWKSIFKYLSPPI